MKKKKWLINKNKIFFYFIFLFFIISCANTTNNNQDKNINESKKSNKNKCYFDKTTGLSFKINDCSPNCLSVYDSSDSLLYSLNNMNFSIKSIHKEYGERFFFIAYVEETKKYEIWEIELELERIMQMDLDTSHINKANVLSACENVSR